MENSLLRRYTISKKLGVINATKTLPNNLILSESYYLLLSLILLFAKSAVPHDSKTLVIVIYGADRNIIVNVEFGISEIYTVVNTIWPNHCPLHNTVQRGVIQDVSAPISIFVCKSCCRRRQRCLYESYLDIHSSLLLDRGHIFWISVWILH